MSNRTHGSKSSVFRLVAVCLCLGLHFSVCTGGLLSVTAALAADFSGFDAEESPAMSRADSDSLLCRFMSFDIRESSEEGAAAGLAKQGEQSTCGGEKSCISASAASLKQRDITLIHSTDAVFFPPFNDVLRPILASTHLKLSRSNQDLSRSRLIASILVKRE